MRFDLHNHTIDYTKAPQVYKRDLQTIYLQIVKLKILDGFAITNFHDIKSALLFAKDLPRYIIVGCEYQVFEGEYSFYIVALGLDETTHNILMRARLRGLKYFTSLLREKEIPYFWVRIGWGMKEESVPLLKSSVHYFDALEIINVTTAHECGFARKLSNYYDLAAIGGSDYTMHGNVRRAYTEAKFASNPQEFLRAIIDKQVVTGIISDSRLVVHNSFSIWQATKNFYRNKLRALWLSELEWSYGGGVEKFKEAILMPSLRWLPQVTHLQQLQNHEKKIARLEEIFINYLKFCETKEVFTLDKNPEEKKILWQQAVAKIHQCFDLSPSGKNDENS